MKEDISVLIADDNVEFTVLLRERICREADIRVDGIAYDGLQAIDMIGSLKPDIVVLDIVMPNLDGIGVLERIAGMKLEKKPLFIMLSAIGQDMFIQKAIILGADYYLVKPFDLDVLVERIRQVHREKCMTSFSNKARALGALQPLSKPSKERGIEIEVTNLIRDAGIPPHMIGYQYVREAIMQAVNNSKSFASITKMLYPSVAKKYDTSPQKVERAIRNAIESAWSRGGNDSMNSIFGYTISSNKGKPTNSEFIAMMADKIRLMSDEEKSSER